MATWKEWIRDFRRKPKWDKVTLILTILFFIVGLIVGFLLNDAARVDLQTKHDTLMEEVNRTNRELIENRKELKETHFELNKSNEKLDKLLAGQGGLADILRKNKDLQFSGLSEEEVERIIYNQTGFTQEEITNIAKEIKNITSSYVELGLSYSTLGDDEKAIDFYKLALQKNSKNAEAWNYLGNSFMAAGNYSEAKKAFDNATNISPDYHIAFYNKGVLFSTINKSPEAIMAYEAAIDINDSFPFDWNNLGMELRKTLDYDRALYCFERAINLSSGVAGIWNNKGITLADLGRLNESLDALNNATNLSICYADAWLNKGNVLYRLGRYKESENAYINAARYDCHYRDLLRKYFPDIEYCCEDYCC